MPGFDPAAYPGARIHGSCYVDAPCEVGPGTSVWHFSHLMAGAKVGAGCNIGQNVVVSPGVVVGDCVKIQNNVSLYTGVELEDYVFCGPSMVFTNVVNPRSEVPRRDAYRRTLVRRGASLGANSTVLCGVTIGRYALVGAGSVVLRDVPSYAVVVGSPARRVKWACRCGESLPMPCSPTAEGSYELACPACGNLYRLDADGSRLAPLHETQDDVQRVS